MQDIEKILKMDNIHILESMVAGDRNLLKWNDEDENNLLITAFNLNLSDEVVDYLIKRIDFETTNSLGISPFSIAIRKGRSNWVEYMINRGIDLNKTERKSNFTPLMEAVTSNRVEIIKTLLDGGADTSLIDSFGFSAVDFARKMKKIEILKLLETPLQA